MSHPEFFTNTTKATFLYHKGKKRTQRTQSEASSTSDFVSFVLLCAFFVKIVSLWNFGMTHVCVYH